MSGGGKMKFYGDGVFSQRRADGKEVFFIRYWWKGREYKEKAGMKLEAARALRALRRCQMDEHPTTFKPPREKKREQSAAVGPLFKEYAERFQRDYVGSIERRSDYYSMMLKELNRHFGERRLRDIKPEDIDQFKVARAAEFREKYGREISPSSLRKQLTVLGTMFRLAMRWRIVTTNPVAEVEFPKEPGPTERYFEPEEFQRVYEALADHFKCVALVAVETGMRRKDILSLTWEHVDFSTGMIHSGGAKTATGYRVAMSDGLRTALEEQRARVRAIGRACDPARLIPWVFVDDDGEPYDTKARRDVVSQAFRRAQRRVGLFKGQPLHVLRHTVGTWLAQAGASAFVIAAQLGHANLQSTRRYVDTVDRQRREAATLLAQRRGVTPLPTATVVRREGSA